MRASVFTIPFIFISISIACASLAPVQACDVTANVPPTLASRSPQEPPGSEIISRHRAKSLEGIKRLWANAELKRIAGGDLDPVYKVMSPLPGQKRYLLRTIKQTGEMTVNRIFSEIVNLYLLESLVSWISETIPGQPKMFWIVISVAEDCFSEADALKHPDVTPLMLARLREAFRNQFHEKFQRRRDVGDHPTDYIYFFSPEGIEEIWI